MAQKISFLLMTIFLFTAFPPRFLKAEDLGTRLSGKILLQVENKGQAWYIDPETQQRAFLGRPADAFKIMRELGLGISEDNYNKFKNGVSKKFSGKILLRVEAKGEAYYINPDDLKPYYLGRPADAFRIMREKGLGITDEDLLKVPVFQKYQEKGELSLDENSTSSGTTEEQKISENKTITNYEQSNKYKEAIKTIILAKNVKIEKLNARCDSDTATFNKRIDYLYNKKSNADKIVALLDPEDNSMKELMKNVSDVCKEEIAFWENKIIDLKTMKKLNNEEIEKYNKMIQDLEPETMVCDQTAYNRFVEFLNGKGWAELAEDALDKGAEQFIKLVRERDDYIRRVSDAFWTAFEYKASLWNSFATTLNNSSINKIKCDINRNYDGTATSIDCY